ncbi:MAG: hypothetical protein K6G45_13030 [Lachnospiraceae bacterium]|nr:hypothetical protein [Lachnospiraceae bacterium]
MAAENKFSYLFNPDDESSKLLLTFCEYDTKVKEDDRQELKQAYLAAADIAECREMKEAEQGLFR